MTVDEVKKRIEELDRAESGKIINYLRGYVYSQDLAEDYLQEAYVEAIMCASKITDPDKFTSWLMTVAIRKAQRGAAEYFRSLETCCRLWYMHWGREIDDYAKVRLSIFLDNVLRSFPPHYGIIMRLHYAEEYTFKEIAHIIDMKPDAVRQAHSRVCRTLRRSISDACSLASKLSYACKNVKSY